MKKLSKEEVAKKFESLSELITVTSADEMAEKYLKDPKYIAKLLSAINDLSNDEELNRHSFWAFIKETSEEVDKWPQWKKDSMQSL